MMATIIEIDKQLRDMQSSIDDLKSQRKSLLNDKHRLIASKQGLKDGSRLLITEECRNHIKARNWHSMEGAAVGNIAEFSGMSGDGKTCSIHSLSSWWSSGAFPFDMVVRMLKAYQNEYSDDEVTEVE